MTEMIQKESLSDDALMPFNSMDKYLINSNNMNPMALQKQVNQNISMLQPNSNSNMAYNGIREGMNEEILRARTCYNPNMTNQIQFNNNGHPLNRMPAMMNPAPMNGGDKLTMHQLYMLSNNCPPIDKLTLSVNNGNLVGPFHLPADLDVTEVEFHLTDDSLNQINIRDDLDIVLLSRFTKDSAMNLLSWPSTMKIFVNDFPLCLDMTQFNKIPLHLPQYIKRNCLPGRNVVKFECFDLSRFNHQLFQFHIYMVHRPTIAHSKKLTLDNALVCDELTMKLLQENCIQMNKEYMKISTICPVTEKRIEIPIRFKDCGHLQPFDLMGFFKLQSRWMLNICPLCLKNVNFNFNGCQQNIVIDHILQKMFEKTPQMCDMIRIDFNGTFTPLIHNPSPEYLQMMAQNNNGVMAMQQRPQFHNINDMNSMMMAQQQQMRPSLSPMYRYMPLDGPGQFMNGIQSPPGLQCRSMSGNGPPVMMANRSMLDFNPCDMYNQIGGPPMTATTHQSPVKKNTKRKAPAKKSAPKTNLDPVINVRSNNTVNNCPTPPSTRTSSVASTSSPDSLSVPHSIPKRSPSIDQISNTILSESQHLNDELLLYSSSSTNHLNTKSVFSESHFSTSVDEQQQQLMSLPQMSSSSFSQAQSIYPQQFSKHHLQQQQHNHMFSQPQPQQKLPSWTLTDSNHPQMFTQQQQYIHQQQQQQQLQLQHQPPLQPQQHTPVVSTTVTPPLTAISEHETELTTNQYDDASSSTFYQDTMVKFVDDILANHEPVPELEECDWLENTYNLVSVDQQMVGLSDVEDF